MSALTEIKVYIELHYTQVRPSLIFELNGQNVEAKLEWSEYDKTNFFEKSIFLLTAELLKHNTFKIFLVDKPELSMDKIHKEHYAVIKNLEVDQIKFDSVLYRVNSFIKFDLSVPWFRHASQYGFYLPETSVNDTKLVANGFWQINFDSPIWKWVAENL